MRYDERHQKAHPARPRGKNGSAEAGVPFETAEGAWFWFMAARAAQADGAVPGKGVGDILRPCESTDILNVLGRLYRGRVLLRDHLLVMRYYGQRFMPPDPSRRREVRAASLWAEAMARLEPALIRRGIVADPMKGAGDVS